MEKCEFEEGVCRTHPVPHFTDYPHRPALCTHAAAELERRVEEAQSLLHESEGLLKWSGQLNNDLESRLARLEEEKVQLQAKAFDWKQHWKDEHMRLILAEAATAAMRDALTALYTFPGVRELLAPKGSLDSIADMVDTALSPAPGRALLDEVEQLREVARAAKLFSKLNIKHLRDWPDDRELWDCGGTMLRVGHVRALRDALAKVRGEEGKHG